MAEGDKAIQRYRESGEASVLRTLNGGRIDLLAPDWRMIRLDEIAHCLAAIPRWGGHRRAQISVAAHSLAVALLAPAPLRLAAALHDAHEAYVGDLTRPFVTALGARVASPLLLAEAVGEIKRDLDRAIAAQVLAQQGGEGVDLLPNARALADEMVCARVRYCDELIGAQEMDGVRYHCGEAGIAAEWLKFVGHWAAMRVSGLPTLRDFPG